MKSDQKANAHYRDLLSRKGLRFTPQRREVYSALLEKRDHPTATEVFMRVKKKVPSISLATVYNCLESLVGQDLVRNVHVERGPARFCPNVEDHGHFFCENCERVIDIDFDFNTQSGAPWRLPPRCVVTHQEVTLKGICPDCAGKNESEN